MPHDKVQWTKFEVQQHPSQPVNNLSMSAQSSAEVASTLQRIDGLVRKGLTDGTIHTVMKENKAEMV